MSTTDVQVWMREPGEPNRWYARFTAFRLLGPARSVLRVFNTEREKAGKGGAPRVPGAWDEAVERWCWRARAEAFDAWMRQQEEAEFAQAKRAMRRRRISILNAATDKLGAALSSALTARLPLPAVVAALVRLNADSRAEFPDTMENGPVPVPSGFDIRIVDASGNPTIDKNRPTIADIENMSSEELRRLLYMDHAASRHAALPFSANP